MSERELYVVKLWCDNAAGHGARHLRVLVHTVTFQLVGGVGHWLQEEREGAGDVVGLFGVGEAAEDPLVVRHSANPSLPLINQYVTSLDGVRGRERTVFEWECPRCGDRVTVRSETAADVMETLWRVGRRYVTLAEVRAILQKSAEIRTDPDPVG
ncbi:MAG: hypothetical protein LKI27_06045 [Actinomyces sp.]|jgi:hypothetical protein|nr:hypothetical protein [Actinomyces sp.]MCI1662443.1 hypothetical protein [Actinomyces sp.]